MKTQEQLNKAVKAAKEEFFNTTSLSGRNRLVLDFIDAFKYTTAGADEAQDAFISGQMDYYNRKLLKVLDKALKHFIDEVKLTAEPDKLKD